MALLEIEGLKTQFFTSAGTVRAVDGVDYTVEEGETVAVVGESGCGKSVTALSIMRLVADPPGKIVEGQIRFKGSDLVALPEEEMRQIRGRDIGMVFQEPMTSLNPANNNAAFSILRYHCAAFTLTETIREPFSCPALPL